ncbi:isochorismate synthase [Bacillus sp. 165]|uniref:isochorismate synthase n=1 Tax=Bacillus sp. 165 TaxID=1529117 RepID=UPI001ADACA90|nr:isochorismate synthase [Bacillus sp. 165]MBO9130934.1 isochorismate synthase [Bacillus sp. 165]
MITTQQQGLHVLLLNALQQAKKNNHAVLVSTVKKVAWIDPLLFYAAAAKIGMTERFYWSDPEQRVTLAGAGSAYIITNHHHNRFEESQNEWEKLLETGLIDGGSYSFGTGPLAFGGFSFDPMKQKTMLWEAFADALLLVPAFMLTIKEDGAWLTINSLVSHKDSVSDLHEKLEILEAKLMSASKQPLQETDTSINIEHEVDPVEWMKAVKQATHEMEQGLYQKVVLARELQLTLSKEVDSANVLQVLRISQSDCYVFSFDYNKCCFIGATPERLIKKEEDVLTSMCLAGTIGRGHTPEEDNLHAQMLLNDEKNLKEHGFVVEMIRTVMKQFCKEVSIPDEPGLKEMKNVLHLYTPVKGIVKEGKSLLSIAERMHPTPALGGTPTSVALERIRELEQLDRGWYAAPIGWVDYQGNGEFAVGIRSALMKGRQASLFAGCGVVKDSDPEAEYEETRIKFKPMLTAFGGF